MTLEWYVSPHGLDSNPGTKEKPFATLERARDAIRLVEEAWTEDATIYVGGGLYRVTEPIRFDSRDSGRDGYRTVYRAVSGERPVVSGGVPLSGWEPVAGTPLWRAVVDGGLASAGYIRSFYVNGRRAFIASSDTSYTGIDVHRDENGDPDGFYVHEQVVSGCGSGDELFIHWNASWKVHVLPVERVEDDEPGRKLIRMKQPYYRNSLPREIVRNGWNPWYDQEFYVENALGLLDEPGEFVYNRKEGALYYYPRPDEDMRAADVVVPVARQLLSIAGTSDAPVCDLAIEGIAFCHTAWSDPAEVGYVTLQAECLFDTVTGRREKRMVPGGLEIDQAKRIRFAGNRIEHIETIGLLLKDGVERIEAEGNLFHDIGHAAIAVGHFATHRDDESLISRQVGIRNNVIRKNGQQFRGSPAISTYYAQNLEIIHNDIADAPYIGISVGWGWSGELTLSRSIIVLNNRIERTFMKTEDGGAIYFMSAHPGSLVSGNYIKDAHFNGIQNDKGTSFVAFTSNVLEGIDVRWRQFSRLVEHCHYADNYTDSAVESSGPGCVGNSIHNTVVVRDGNWPEEARRIMRKAGLEEPFRQLLHELPRPYEYAALEENFHIPDYIREWQPRAPVDSKLAPLLAPGASAVLGMPTPPDSESAVLSNGQGEARAVTRHRFEVPPDAAAVAAKWRFRLAQGSRCLFRLMSGGQAVVQLVVDGGGLWAESRRTERTLIAERVPLQQWNAIDLQVDVLARTITARLKGGERGKPIAYGAAAGGSPGSSLDAFEAEAPACGERCVLHLDDLAVRVTVGERSK